jgi:hypothetical protein
VPRPLPQKARTMCLSDNPFQQPRVVVTHSNRMHAQSSIDFRQPAVFPGNNPPVRQPYLFSDTACLLHITSSLRSWRLGGSSPRSRHAKTKTTTRQLARALSPHLRRLGDASRASRRFYGRKNANPAPLSRLVADNFGGNRANTATRCHFCLCFTQYSVLSTQYSVLSTQYSVLCAPTLLPSSVVSPPASRAAGGSPSEWASLSELV